ncbi:hypothetical protein SBRY_10470 [Actinacidiphila bryophytorum]|uniref:Uncharacterized protein n=1 Tax=Actinacidiphila bryophytorum TaxID=1436133 RepID=A0A9W4GX67_9ACTN|nr:hypothetical protein SBRY_10470 [Actinacidiphila bryophytorum]
MRVGSPAAAPRASSVPMETATPEQITLSGHNCGLSHAAPSRGAPHATLRARRTPPRGCGRAPCGGRCGPCG